MADKPRFPRAAAIAVAKQILSALEPVCERIIVAGSLRRMKQEVGDVEILYIPKIERHQTGADLLGTPEFEDTDLTRSIIASLEAVGVLERRLNSRGFETFGNRNKLMRHPQSGIPVDLFATTPEVWFNYLVCRTGGAVTNTDIALRAIKRGWKWNPYGPGFSRGAQIMPMRSEEEVFRFVNLPFLSPAQRK